MKLHAIPTAVPQIPPSIRPSPAVSANAAANKVTGASAAVNKATNVAGQSTKATNVRHGHGYEPARKAGTPHHADARTRGQAANKAARGLGVEPAGDTKTSNKAHGADQVRDTKPTDKNRGTELIADIERTERSLGAELAGDTEKPEKTHGVQMSDFRKPAISTSAAVISQSSSGILPIPTTGPVFALSDAFLGDIDLGDFASSAGSVRPSTGPFVATGYALEGTGGNTAVVDRSSGAAAIVEPLVAGHESAKSTAGATNQASGPSGVGNGVGASTPGGIEPIGGANGTASGDSNGNPNNQGAGSGGPVTGTVFGQGDLEAAAQSGPVPERVPTPPPANEMANALKAYEKALGLSGPDKENNSLMVGTGENGGPPGLGPGQAGQTLPESGPFMVADEPETIDAVAVESQSAPQVGTRVPGQVKASVATYQVEFTRDLYAQSEKTVDLVI